MKNFALIIAIISSLALLSLLAPQIAYGDPCSCTNPDSECTPKVCGDAGNCTPSCISPRFCVDNLAWDKPPPNNCCCIYQSSNCELSGLCGGEPTPPPSTDPGTVTGRVYCLNPSSPTNNYNVSGALIRVLESGNLLDMTSSDNTGGTEADNFSMTFTPDSSSSTFAVRSGLSGGNGLYSPINQRPFCSTAHESCSFSSVEGTTVSNFDFFTDLIVPDGSSACTIPGDSVTLSWPTIPQASSYNLRIDNAKDPWFTKGSDYFMVVPSHPDSSCTATSCLATISTSSTPPLEVGQKYWWSVQPVDIDGGQHCQGSGGSFSCACTLPGTPTGLSADVPECSDTADTVTLSWDDMPNTDSYGLRIDEKDYTILDSSCSGGRCSFNFTANPLQGYPWTVYAENSCGQSSNAISSFNMDACAVAWMQTIDADLLTKGDIESWVPSGKYLIANSSRNSPGVAIYGQGAGDDIQTHDGSISTTNWNANSGYSFPTNRYTYAYFENLAPRSGNDKNPVIPIGPDDIGDDGTLNGGNFLSGTRCPFEINGTEVEYCWFKYDGDELGGDLIINDNELINNKKIILMVENANLQFGLTGQNAERKIQVQEGDGFFLVIVEGNINVFKEFYHSAEIALEGIYFTENSFVTEEGSDKQLDFKGMLAAMGGLNLQRDLGLPGNTSTPSELFEYGPEYIFHFPSIFSSRKTIWREVAP